jgi:hypothetical protein
MKKLIILLLAAIATACLPEKGKTARTCEEQRTQDSAALKVALMPTQDCLPFYYACDQGIYERLGLQVKFLTYNSMMDCDTAFTRGHAELSYTDLVRAAFLQDTGTGLYVIAQTDGGEELITFKDKKIKKLTRLKDRMVGLARNSLGDFLTDRFSDSLHFSGMDVFRPQVNDVILRTDMLCNNMLDAAFLPEPYASRTKADGHIAIYGSRQNNLGLTGLMITAEAANDSSRREQTRLLIEGYNQAAKQLNAQLTTDSLRTRLASLCQLKAHVIDGLPPLRFQPLGLHTRIQTDTVAAWVRRRKPASRYSGDTLILKTFIKP